MKINNIYRRIFRKDPNMLPNICYSQNGEDLILNRFLENKKNGFYIDIGAHHPIRFSNTYLFYKKGWRGINIDAMPGSMDLFNKIRSRDINIEKGIANIKSEFMFYQFNESALNTFCKKEAFGKNRDNYKIINKSIVKVDTLENLLNKFLPKDIEIDFMNIDVEGKDEEVLFSNNWNKYRPNIILVESLKKTLINKKPCSIIEFLNSKGYSLLNKAYDTFIFKNNSTNI